MPTSTISLSCLLVNLVFIKSVIGMSKYARKFHPPPPPNRETVKGLGLGHLVNLKQQNKKVETPDDWAMDSQTSQSNSFSSLLQASQSSI